MRLLEIIKDPPGSGSGRYDLLRARSRLADPISWFFELALSHLWRRGFPVPLQVLQVD